MYLKSRFLIPLVGFMLVAVPGSAQIEVVPTTADGMVPGTSISYTITATGMAREIWAPGASDSGTWEWFNGFPEFVGVGPHTLTVDFSDPVELNRIILGVNSISFDPFTLTVSGGTGATTDFDLVDGIAAVGGAGTAMYDGATGEFTITGGDESVMIGSSSSNTVTQISITGDGGGDGFTLFFGPTQTGPPSPVVAIPTLDDAGIAILFLLLVTAAVFVLRRRL